MKKKKIIFIVVIIILLCILGGYATKYFLIDSGKFKLENIKILCGISNKNLVDDWEYRGYSISNDLAAISGGIYKGNINSYVTSDSVMESASVNSGTIGLAVGGSKNINNFRENIENGYFPISTDITYNGLFYDYYFDTGKGNIQSNELFSPSYSTAISKDPISGELEYYMTVGLNSNIKESDFERKKLNLVVVLDISGSMSSGLNSYYYDGEKNEDEEYKTKMQIANESVNLLMDELNEDDRLGIVLFDEESYLAKPINLVGKTDIKKIKEHVLEISPQGGTNFDAGYTTGTELFTEQMLNDSEYENRIIVITDAMPNMGETSRDNLARDIKENANNGIYTSFIGVGVDFNTQVIECLSNVKGANYYSVHSSEEFKKIMSEDFDYMVTPLVFDLELNFESDVFSIEKVYGTDAVDSSKGNIMKVNTLFPSSSNSRGEAKGGVILLKLKCNLTCGTQYEEEIENAKMSLSVSYKDRNGVEHSNLQNVKFEEAEKEGYDNTGIRKAIVLTRYANLMKNWILFERSEEDNRFLINSEIGIEDCDYSVDEIYIILSENERASVKLSVSEEYGELFKKFKVYLENEIEEIGDKELEHEVEILNLLIEI